MNLQGYYIMTITLIKKLKLELVYADFTSEVSKNRIKDILLQCADELLSKEAVHATRELFWWLQEVYSCTDGDMLDPILEEFEDMLITTHHALNGDVKQFDILFKNFQIKLSKYLTELN